jgi:hypothetical protein
MRHRRRRKTAATRYGSEIWPLAGVGLKNKDRVNFFKSQWKNNAIGALAVPVFWPQAPDIYKDSCYIKKA